MLCAGNLRELSKNILTIPLVYCTRRSVTQPHQCNLNLIKLLSSKTIPSSNSGLEVESKTMPSSSSGLEVNSQQIGAKDGFITIYRLPSIGKVALINRAKRIHSIIFPITAATSFALSFADIVPLGTSLVILCAGAVLALKLYVLGLFTTNLVGFVYTCPDMSTVQISYLDHNGRRREAIFPASDISPLSEAQSHFLEQHYSKLYRYSEQPPTQFYKLSLCYGNVTNDDCFAKIFGKI